MANSLKIAVSQFPVSSDIKRNLGYIIRHIKKAASSKADVVHFPELALSGYETNIDEINWLLINESIEKLKRLAVELNINIIVGVHKRSKNYEPFNSTCVITKDGIVAGEYIKSRIYDKEEGKFSIKENTLVCEINGVKCGFLICYESNFPALFQKYKDQNVEVLFLSYYVKSSKPKNSMDDFMRAQFITRATDNLMYISGSNSSARYSRMPSSFVCPDGTITSLKRHKSGILLCDYPKADLGWTLHNQRLT